ncbi:hypothetical protein DFJ74DRAFT_713062 [Hyaloraphidium curvatum]|nr:hypothetical protein DFJ74DRAFT_713062 [Hyaloraphidium curvatum]
MEALSASGRLGTLATMMTASRLFYGVGLAVLFRHMDLSARIFFGPDGRRRRLAFCGPDADASNDAVRAVLERTAGLERVFLLSSLQTSPANTQWAQNVLDALSTLQLPKLWHLGVDLRCRNLLQIAAAPRAMPASIRRVDVAVLSTRYMSHLFGFLDRFPGLEEWSPLLDTFTGGDHVHLWPQRARDTLSTLQLADVNEVDGSGTCVLPFANLRRLLLKVADGLGLGGFGPSLRTLPRLEELHLVVQALDFGGGWLAGLGELPPWLGKLGFWLYEHSLPPGFADAVSSIFRSGFPGSVVVFLVCDEEEMAYVESSAVEEFAPLRAMGVRVCLRKSSFSWRGLDWTVFNLYE